MEEAFILAVLRHPVSYNPLLCSMRSNILSFSLCIHLWKKPQRTTKKFWFQLLKSDFFLVSFLLYDTELNILTFEDVIVGIGKYWSKATCLLTSSVFIVVTEVCVDGPAELQDVIPLVLVHPLVLWLLWERQEERSEGSRRKTWTGICTLVLPLDKNVLVICKTNLSAYTTLIIAKHFSLACPYNHMRPRDLPPGTVGRREREAKFSQAAGPAWI